jgi:hypothetical protein
LNAIQTPEPSNALVNQALTTPAFPGCTNGCTNEAGITNAGTVEALAAILLRLPEGDKARLAALLAATPTEQGEGKDS